MKKIHYLFGFIAIFFLWSCTKDSFQKTPIAIDVPLPDWVKEKMAMRPAEEIISDDFAQADTPVRVELLATTIQNNMRQIGRDVPAEVCYSIALGEYNSAQLDDIREKYFYNEKKSRSEEFLKTRVVHNNQWHYYSTPGIYFYLVTHLNTVLPEGVHNAINYNTAGVSATRVTFADVTVAGKALNKNGTQYLFQFDPLMADFHYYEATGQPVIFSTWAFEMVYEDDVVYNGQTILGPFGSQDGSNMNYPFMFATPANETFTFTPDLPDFPLYDALWYFPIQGLGAVYVLGEDL